MKSHPLHTFTQSAVTIASVLAMYANGASDAALSLLDDETQKKLKQIEVQAGTIATEKQNFKHQLDAIIAKQKEDIGKLQNLQRKTTLPVETEEKEEIKEIKKRSRFR